MTPDISCFAKMRERDLSRDGYMVGEGRLLAKRMLETNQAMISVLASPDCAAEFTQLCAGRCPMQILPEEEISQIAGYKFHRGVLAAAKVPQTQGLAEFEKQCQAAGKEHPCRIIICPDVNDAENLGSIYRSAVALGWDAVFIGPQCTSPYSRRALRSSMGASISTRTVLLNDARDLAILEEHGFLVLGASLKPEAQEITEIADQLRELGDLNQATVPIALLFGNEFSGITPEWEAYCQRLVRIPMFNGSDSLNIGVAAGIFLYSLGPHGR